MSEQSLSPFRQRMIEDMTARRFKANVQRDYVRAREDVYEAFLGRSPDKATSEDLRRFQLHHRKAAYQPDDHQFRHLRVAVLFHRDARKARSRSSSEDRDQAAQGAGRAEPGRGGASPPGRAGPQVQGRAQRRLWRRPPGVRGREPEGVRHPRIKSGDQWAHDAQGRAGQGTAGSRCDAVAATARTVARMVEGGAAAGLALSRPEPDQSGDAASTQPRRHRRQGPGRNLQARFSPYAAGSPGFDPGIATHLLEQGVDIRVIQVLFETDTYCPPTTNRGTDPLSVSSSVRRNGAHPQAIRVSRDRSGRHSSARRNGSLYPRLDDARVGRAP